ncbi:fumarylacetoacetate hydrolase [Corynespora cassiicola Philippines]|uniref:Fumarylacetoacetate hydrolase n=1 Tax=Corynespora cassiicola Philippines TaxID=1448308 RepID=A0A2T2P4Q7_CORCC|nr:fumarylacetoacetate hydrolase [Corynespora cassiicola Philippines]
MGSMPVATSFGGIQTSWSRLVRFVAVEDQAEHVGEPLDRSVDIGAALASGSEVLVREFTGQSVIAPSATPTSRTLTIQTLLPPLSKAEIGTIRCIGLNYRNHAKEMNMEIPDYPTLFFKPSTCLNNPNASLVIPYQATSSHESDYEAELAIVIGKAIRNATKEEAMDYVLGFTCSNDVTARIHQFRGAQWGYGKGFDGFAPMGPCVVAAHSIPDLGAITLKTTLNGEVMQEGKVDDMIFGIPEIVSYLSQGTTLEAGTVIMTGTPHGIGVSKTPKVYLKHGDDLRVVMSHGLGSLVSSVEYEKILVKV